MMRLIILLVLLGGGLMASGQHVLAASASEQRRVEIGLKIFRATLAADQQLSRKLDPQQHLLIVLFYGHEASAAKRYRQHLAQPGGLLKYSLHIVLSNNPTLSEFSTTPPAAIFITEPRLPLATLQRLQSFSIRHNCLLFSPFEADVKRGVAAGLFIGARVEPYVNAKALQASGLELQNFFLSIAKQLDSEL
ncbi:hypothetical protein [Rhabdochromatium marinum]|uniref:hypothetical protein n=1 Tax=Rhabdochromatium marinum TaxID=48729 RepID=UPI0019030F0F|nr:hypothetical protein [Rhabdochromatium marinum]